MHWARLVCATLDRVPFASGSCRLAPYVRILRTDVREPECMRMRYVFGVQRRASPNQFV